MIQIIKYHKILRKKNGMGYRTEKDFINSLSDKQFNSLKENYQKNEIILVTVLSLLLNILLLHTVIISI